MFREAVLAIPKKVIGSYFQPLGLQPRKDKAEACVPVIESARGK
jgi:hypothetical protein